jgi:(p)ppGpp synthase/HD superfamily hydrolase
MLETALNIVNQAFAQHTDKAGQPYIGHLLRVQQTVAERGGDAQRQTIALLHDLLEDTPYTAADLREIFPEAVVVAVELLTKQDGQTYEAYLQALRQNEDAVAVKLADLKDNMDLTRLPALTEKDWSRLQKYHRAHRFLCEENL